MTRKEEIGCFYPTILSCCRGVVAVGGTKLLKTEFSTGDNFCANECAGAIVGLKEQARRALSFGSGVRLLGPFLRLRRSF